MQMTFSSPPTDGRTLELMNLVRRHDVNVSERALVGERSYLARTTNQEAGH